MTTITITMKITSTLPLYAIQGSISENALYSCIKSCNAEININTQNPYEIIHYYYDYYVAMVKVDEAYYNAQKCLDPKLPKKKFIPLDFISFFLELDSHVDESLKRNQFMEYLYVFQNS